jgi:hypothetical protein
MQQKLSWDVLVKKFPTFYGNRSFITVLVKKFPTFYGNRTLITIFRRPTPGPYVEVLESFQHTYTLFI